MAEFFTITGVILFYVAITVTVFTAAFAPTIVAWYRKHPDLLWIFVLNFGLGGTCIGWIIALIWAFKNNWRLDKALNYLNTIGNYHQAENSNK